MCPLQLGCGMVWEDTGWGGGRGACCGEGEAAAMLPPLPWLKGDPTPCTPPPPAPPLLPPPAPSTVNPFCCCCCCCCICCCCCGDCCGSCGGGCGVGRGWLRLAAVGMKKLISFGSYIYSPTDLNVSCWSRGSINKRNLYHYLYYHYYYQYYREDDTKRHNSHLSY